MSRSKDTWLSGPSDIREAEVADVPVPGESVLVRGLSARYSADVNSKLKLVQEGGSQTAKVDLFEMEVVKFVHGVVDPQFSESEARSIAERFGPAWQKVIGKIDELSGLDQEGVKKTEERFRVGGTPANGTAVGHPPEPVVAAGSAGVA